MYTHINIHTHRDTHTHTRARAHTRTRTHVHMLEQLAEHVIPPARHGPVFTIQGCPNAIA